MFEATVLAILVVFVPLGAIRAPEGDPSVDAYSFVSMTLVCFCTNLRLAVELHSWSALEHIGMWGSILVIEFSMIVFSYCRCRGRARSRPRRPPPPRAAGLVAGRTRGYGRVHLVHAAAS